MTRSLTVVALAAFMFTATAALAAGTPEQQCLSGRAKAQGKYQSCVQKALAKSYGGGFFPHSFLSKCRTKYAAAWDKLVTLATAPCAGNRWVDNGLTVTDNLTGLIWEKKTNLDSTPNASDRHDADNTYSWSSSGDGDVSDEDGTAFTDFLTNLNAGAGFAGANGWRLPTLSELMTILLPEKDPCPTFPCIDSTFGPSTWQSYWSATTFAGDPTVVWLVTFYDGMAAIFSKTDNFDGSYVRAVRSGL